MDDRVIPVHVVRAVHDHELWIDRRELVLEAGDERVHRHVLDTRLVITGRQDERGAELLRTFDCLGGADREPIRDRRDDERDVRPCGGELGDETACTRLDVVGVRTECDGLADVIESHGLG